MEILEILFLLLLFTLTIDAASRVERATDCPKITNFSGRVKYRRKGTRAVFKCPKKFTRHGAKFAVCQDDGTWNAEPPLCTKTGCVPLDPSQVTNLDMDVLDGALVKFSCLHDYLLIGATQAYCNGKDWSDPLPRCAAPHELTECDFEIDLCGWSQDDNDEQDWIRNVGPTPTGNTGPKHDHTYGDSGDGHYMFFETSNPTMTGHQAALLSPVYTESISPICFDFWYHILGPQETGHVGSVEVYVLDQSQFIDDDGIQPLFVKEGNQGDEWHRGDVFIDTQDEPFQIAIVATRALSYIGDIAIDDVRLYNCTQATSSTSTTSTTTTQSTTIPSTKTTTSTVTTMPSASSTSPTLKTLSSTVPSTKRTSIVSSTVKISNTETSTPTTTTTPTKQTSNASPKIKTPNTLPSSKHAQSSKEEKSTSTTVKSTNQPPIITSSQASVKTSTPIATTTTTTTKASLRTTFSSTKISKQTSPLLISTKTSSKPTKRSSTVTRPKSSPVARTSKQTKISSTTSQSTVTPSKALETSTIATKKLTTNVATRASTKHTRTPKSPGTTPTVTDSTSIKTSSSRPSSTPSSAIISSSTVRMTKRIDRSTKGTSTTQKQDKFTTTKTMSTRQKSTTKPTPGFSTKSSKATKRTNALTSKTPFDTNTTKDNSMAVSDDRSQHPDDETLKPLLIGLCVGIVAGLIIIGVIAYVCVRRRKFYTSRYEDELKPITNSASIQSLNNGHFYQDEEYESES